MMCLVALLLLTSLAYSQSLGDVARETREKKAATSTPPKVITNTDLTGETDADDSSAAMKKPADTPRPANMASGRRATAQREAEQRAGVLWRQRIIAQKNLIATLQLQAEQMKASIHPANPAAPYDSGVYTAYQQRQLERLKVTELQIEQQKRALDDLQEAARKAGMHTAVYDP